MAWDGMDVLSSAMAVLLRRYEARCQGWPRLILLFTTAIASQVEA